MTKQIFTSILTAIFLMGITTIDAQVEVKKKTEQRADKKIEQSIDKGLNKTEEKIGNLFKKKKKKQPDLEKATPQNEQHAAKEEKATAAKKEKAAKKATLQASPELHWAKYDFIPGDKVIFEDNQTGEENGEFPSRWDLHDGNVEIAVLGGENVIMFREYGSTIIPYLKNSKQDYLPEVFTIEFDAYIPNDGITVYFSDVKNQSSPRGRNYLNVWGNGMDLHPASSRLPDNKKLNNQWIHVAIAYTRGKMKAYINDTRLINIPHLSFEPSGISIRALHSGTKAHFYIKKVRIAEGGVKYYDRLLQDGKITTNGIRFNINEATLLPESMGIINEMVGMMKEHPEISLSVEGHTDSDGESTTNEQLSVSRAHTVVSTMTTMGIETTRLRAKGHGESQPVDTNETPEGRANNRRVEFIKM